MRPLLTPSLEVGHTTFALCPHLHLGQHGQLGQQGRPAFRVLLCQKIKSSQPLTSEKQVRVFQDLDATADPRALLHPMRVPLAPAMPFLPS